MVFKVLAVVFAILMIPSVVLWWFEHGLINTRSYTEIVTPLASDPDVQDALAHVISAEIRDDLDIAAMMDGAAQDLPPKSADLMRSLSQPMELAVDNYIQSAVQNVLSSDEFADEWVEINREAHGRALTIQDDTVYLNLGPIVEAVKADLTSQGSKLAPHIPPVDEEYPLLTSPILGEIKRHQQAIQVLMFALPILAAILLAVAIWLSRERFETVLIASMGTTIGMLGLLAATYVGHSVAAPDTGIAVYEAFTVSLRSDVRWVLLISAVTALTTWVLKRRFTDKPGPTKATRRT